MSLALLMELMPSTVPPPGQFVIWWHLPRGEFGGPITISAATEDQARFKFSDANPTLTIASLRGTALLEPEADPIAGATLSGVPGVPGSRLEAVIDAVDDESIPKVPEQIIDSAGKKLVKKQSNKKIMAAVVLGLLFGVTFVALRMK